MYAARFIFPNGFLGEMEFVLGGKTLNGLIMEFCDVQDLDMHVENIRDSFSLQDKEKWDLSESFYNKVMDHETISEEEFTKFMALDETVCIMTDFSKGENAAQKLHEKYPEAMYRKPIF